MMGTSIRMSKGVSCWPTQFLRTTTVLGVILNHEDRGVLPDHALADGYPPIESGGRRIVVPNDTCHSEGIEEPIVAIRQLGCFTGAPQ